LRVDRSSRSARREESIPVIAFPKTQSGAASLTGPAPAGSTPPSAPTVGLFPSAAPRLAPLR